MAQESKGCDAVLPKYITPMSGFDIKKCAHREYNMTTFQYEKVDGTLLELTTSGVYRRISFERREKQSRKISGIQIKENYAMAVVKAQGELMIHKRDLINIF